jgi:hypothetical protein
MIYTFVRTGPGPYSEPVKVKVEADNLRKAVDNAASVSEPREAEWTFRLVSIDATMIVWTG